MPSATLYPLKTLLSDMYRGAISILIFICFFGLGLNAQEQFLTKQGRVSFFSHSTLEDIKAENDQVLSIIDTVTHKIAIRLQMREFEFEKSLMQEHFNENYVESYKYPKATFSGKVVNFETWDTDNAQTEIIGELTLHGKTKEISTKVNVAMKDDELILKGSFEVAVSDFNIKIPAIVRYNIAETINVSFELHHKPYNQQQ